MLIGVFWHAPHDSPNVSVSNTTSQYSTSGACDPEKVSTAALASLACWCVVADLEVGCVHYVSHNSVFRVDKFLCWSCHVLRYEDMINHIKSPC